MAAALPELIEITHLFTMLFGQDTVCTKRKLPLSKKECVIVAAYRDNCGAIRRVLTCDLTFANTAGAALSAIPSGTANEAIRAGEVPENVFMNLSEVMNIAVNLFTESFGGRLELECVARQNELTPETLATLASADRLKIDVVIPRYAAGRIDLIAV